MDATQTKSHTHPTLLAKLSGQLGIVAVGILILTCWSPINIPGEICALSLACVALLFGIVALAATHKYGVRHILKPAILGIALNGLLLSIAISNFICARNETIQRHKGLTIASIPNKIWNQYQVAGLQFISPIKLAVTDVNSQQTDTNAETYRGEHMPSGTVFILHRRKLTESDDYTLESFTAEVVDLLKQKNSETLQTNFNRVIDNIPSKQFSAELEAKGFTFMHSILILRKPPFIWELQILRPKDFSEGETTEEKIFSSIKFIP